MGDDAARQDPRPRPHEVLRIPAFALFWSATTARGLGGAVSGVAVQVLIVSVLEATPSQIGVLSAVGVEHLIASLNPEAKVVRRRLEWFTLGTAVLLVLGLAGTYPLAISLSTELQKESFDVLAIAGIMSTLHTATFFALALMALFCLVLFLLWRPERLRTWAPVNPLIARAWQRMMLAENLPLTLALSLAALAVLQLAWVADQFIQPIPIKILTETNPLLDTLRAEGDAVRCSVAPQDQVLNELLQNQFAAMDISCLDISAASRIPDDLNSFLQTLDSQQEKIWFLSGVKNVVVPQAGVEQMQQDPGVGPNIDHADGYTLVPTGNGDLPSHAIVTLKHYFNKATLIPGAEFFKTPEDQLARLKDTKWDPRATLLLDAADQTADSPAATGAATDEVGLQVYTPTHIQISARSAKGGYVLVNDHYDPDWSVQVNGRDAKVLRADYLLRAVQVPPGESTVTMNYAAHYHLGSHTPGARGINNLSDGAMLASFLVAVVALVRRKPEGQARA